MRLRKEFEEDPEGLRQRWWRGGGRRVVSGREAGRMQADGSFTGANKSVRERAHEDVVY
jgi:hypothetical protein